MESILIEDMYSTLASVVLFLHCRMVSESLFTFNLFTSEVTASE